MLVELLKLIVLLLIPTIFSWLFQVFRFVRNWKNHTRFHRESDKNEVLSILVSLAYFTFCIIRLLDYRKEYFYITRTPIASPSYLIRNNFRQYVDDLRTTNPKFDLMYTQRMALFEQDGSTDENELVTSFPDLEKQFIREQKLSFELRSIKFSRNYNYFGEEAAISCTICDENDGWSFVLFILPSILSCYLMFSGVLWTYSSRSPLKSGWKLPFFVSNCIVFTIELGWRILSDFPLIIPVSFSSSAAFITFHGRLKILRFMFLAAMTLILIVFDRPSVKSPRLEALERIQTELEISTYKLQISRYIRILMIKERKPNISLYELQRNLPLKLSIDSTCDTIQTFLNNKFRGKKLKLE